MEEEILHRFDVLAKQTHFRCSFACGKPYKAGVACCRLKLERLFQFRRILPSREKIQQPVLSPVGLWSPRTEKRSRLMRPGLAPPWRRLGGLLRVRGESGRH